MVCGSEKPLSHSSSSRCRTRHKCPVRDAQKFLHLPVPVLPIMRPRQLAEFVRNFFLHEQVYELTVIDEKKILGPTVKVDERDRFHPLRSHRTDHPEYVVGHSRLRPGRAED